MVHFGGSAGRAEPFKFTSGDLSRTCVKRQRSKSRKDQTLILRSGYPLDSDISIICSDVVFMISSAALMFRLASWFMIDALKID